MFVVTKDRNQIRFGIFVGRYVSDSLIKLCAIGFTSGWFGLLNPPFRTTLLPRFDILRELLRLLFVRLLLTFLLFIIHTQ